MKETVLFVAKLDESHNQRPNSKRVINGIENHDQPFEIKIIRYDDDLEVYLIEFDAKGNEIIDTFHENIERAKKHAEFDWGIKISDWNPPSVQTF